MIALAALLALTVPALAGGVVVTLDSAPTDVRAGVPFDIGFMIISAHEGHEAMTGGSPTLIARNPDTGELVTVQGVEDGKAGHYLASITLPSGGSWNWEIQVWGQKFTMSPIDVGAAGAQPVQAAQSAATLPALEVRALLPVLAALVLLGALAGGVLVLRGRRVEAR
jgi:hypothetical protein